MKLKINKELIKLSWNQEVLISYSNCLKAEVETPHGSLINDSGRLYHNSKNSAIYQIIVLF